MQKLGGSITLDAWPWLRGMLWVHDVDDNVGISLWAPLGERWHNQKAHGACFKDLIAAELPETYSLSPGILWKSPIVGSVADTRGPSSFSCSILHIYSNVYCRYIVQRIPIYAYICKVRIFLLKTSPVAFLARLQVPKATTGRGAWNLGKSSWKFHCKNLEKPCENVMKPPNSWVWNGMIFGAWACVFVGVHSPTSSRSAEVWLWARETHLTICLDHFH